MHSIDPKQHSGVSLCPWRLSLTTHVLKPALFRQTCYTARPSIVLGVRVFGRQVHAKAFEVSSDDLSKYKEEQAVRVCLFNISAGSLHTKRLLWLRSSL